jgi:hypothetical protein
MTATAQPRTQARPSITRALIEKDLRDLRPWGVLCLCIALFDVFEYLLSQVDLRPAGIVHELLGSEHGRLMWMLAFAIGTGLGTREQDESTLSFLDGLPLGRARVFLVKCVVTAAMVIVTPTLGLFTIVGLHLLSRGSLDYALRLDLLLSAYALHAGLIVHGVVVGAAIGFLRSLTWLIAGVAASVLAVAVDRFPRIALLNPLSLTDAQLLDSGLVVDLETLVVQAGFALFALALGLYGFSRAGRPSAVDLRQRPVLRAITTGATALALTGALVLWVRSEIDEGNVESEETDEDAPPEFPQSPPAQTETRHYRISYPALNADQAKVLADRADAIFEAVHARLGAAHGERIDVDASGSARNTEGTAYFGRIRMALGEDAALVLAHETAHVVAQRLAGAERDWLWRKARVLDEGLATYMERVVGEAGARDEARLVLAALHARGELRVEELVDLDLLASRRDENLKYTAGTAVIEATAQLYGEAALGKLVRAFGNDKLAVDLNGMALWQAAYQGAGYDLGAVLDAMFRAIARDGKERAEEIAALPRPRVRLVKEGDLFGVQPLLDTPDALGRGIFLRFKPAADSEATEYDLAVSMPGEPSWRADEQVQGGQICVQPGVNLEREVLYEPWVCLPTGDAAPYVAPADAGSPQ